MKQPSTVRTVAALAAVLCSTAGVAVSTPAAAATACRVDYAVTSQWPGGFVANVALTNVGDPLNGWTMSWSFADGQAVTSAWNATVTQSGSTVTASSVSWNSSVATNGTVSFGFQGTSGTTNRVPGGFTVNGVACSGTDSTTATTTTTRTTTTATATTTTTRTTTSSTTGPTVGGGRRMESLGRGVVAVRASGSSVLVSWRLLGLDPDGIGFNVYRSTGGGAAVRLNGSVITGGTNYLDTSANLGQANSYHVRPVVNGAEQAASGSFTLRANSATEPVVRVPLRANGTVKFVWAGDLDGDGEYDYVVDRQTSPQKLEAYRRDGTFLWAMDLGPNSTDQNNIEGGSSTIDVGHNDGSPSTTSTVTAGRGGGADRQRRRLRQRHHVHPGRRRQPPVHRDPGRPDGHPATAPVTDYLSDGPMYARFGVGYLTAPRRAWSPA